MERSQLDSLRKAKLALEQIREKSVGFHDFSPIEIDVSTVHWIQGEFDVERRAFEVCALYDVKRLVFSSVDVPLGNEAQRHFFLCKEGKEKTAAEALERLVPIFAKALGATAGISIGGVIAGNGNPPKHRSEDTDVKARDEILSSWCSLLYWVSQFYVESERSAKAFFTRHKNLDTQLESIFSGNEAIELENTEVQDREFQEWYRLGASVDWVPAATISRFDKREKTLRDWVSECKVAGLASPAAIACSSSCDLIQASKQAIDYLIHQAATSPPQSNSISSVNPTRRQIGEKKSNSKILLEILDVLMRHHHCYVTSPQNDALPALTQSQVVDLLSENKKTEASQASVSRAFRKLMDIDWELNHDAYKAVKSGTKKSVKGIKNDRNSPVIDRQGEWKKPADWYDACCKKYEICAVLTRCQQIVSFERMIEEAEDKEKREFAEKRLDQTRKAEVALIKKELEKKWESLSRQEIMSEEEGLD